MNHSSMLIPPEKAAAVERFDSMARGGWQELEAMTSEELMAFETEIDNAVMRTAYIDSRDHHAKAISGARQALEAERAKRRLACIY